ncbi:MAG: hypothetical protein DRI57_28105 [Deltaproteobacteria bacterium]|nr:MAG: hypothetical protein DRI57_28105 [Deltaproteobacteria bacterium]
MLILKRSKTKNKTNSDCTSQMSFVVFCAFFTTKDTKVYHEGHKGFLFSFFTTKDTRFTTKDTKGFTKFTIFFFTKGLTVFNVLCKKNNTKDGVI